MTGGLSRLDSTRTFDLERPIRRKVVLGDQEQVKRRTNPSLHAGLVAGAT
jgi:hypothetical protein